MLAFDFSALLGSSVTLTAPVVSVALVSGTDDNPQAILSGSATLSAAQVLQRVQRGVAQATYSVRAQVDASDGSRYVLAGLLPVRVA